MAVITRNYSPAISFAGFRFLRIRIKADTASSPFRLVIGTKQWVKDYLGADLRVGTSYTDVDVDLCAPTNLTAVTDKHGTRWPLEVSTDTISADGAMWGVTNVSTLTFDNLSSGVTYTVESLKLVRHSYARATLLGGGGNVQESFAGYKRLRRFLLGDTDGRQSIEEPDYQLWSAYSDRLLNDLILDVQTADGGTFRNPGWYAISLDMPPDCSPDADGMYTDTALTRCYHNNNLPANYAYGGGCLYDLGWKFGFDLDVGSPDAGGPPGQTVASVPATFSVSDINAVQTVTFAIPAGTWTSAQWRIVGDTTTVFVIGNHERITTSGHTADMPNLPTVPAHHDDTISASGSQLTDINSAAGSNLTATVEILGGASLPLVYNDHVTVFQLILVGTTPVPSGGLTIKAQALWDSVNYYPECGDVWTPGSPYGGAIPLYAAHVRRGQAHGLTFKMNDLVEPGVSVSMTQEVGGGFAGLGISGSDGAYQTGIPYGKGYQSHKIAARDRSVSQVLASRYRQRVCFRVAGGTWRAIEADSARAWIHLSDNAQVATYQTLDWIEAQRSPAYAVSSWRKFRLDPRTGNLLMLGTQGATLRVYLSSDGGYSGAEVLNVTATSGVIERDSERGLLVFLWENGAVVQRQISQDGGATWGAAANVKMDGSNMNAITLVDMTQDPRWGLMALVINIGGSFKVLISDDDGENWATRLT